MLNLPRSLGPTLGLAALLGACSGSSSGGDGAPTVTLAVTDAASDRLSTFVIGLESVELESATNPPVELLAQGVAVDFAALTDLSRVLGSVTVPVDVYTGVRVSLIYDSPRIHLNNDVSNSTPADLYDADGGAQLAGSTTIPIAFPAPIQLDTGNLVLEVDLDLNQSLEIDAGLNRVYLEPTLLPRLNPSAPREHAVAGDLRTVVVENDLFRIGLPAPFGQPVPVVTVNVDSTTVFQINGVCLVGAAGLSALDTLSPGDWVQAFGDLSASTARFDATTVEAGTGSYNGGSDIVEGLIIDRDPTGADATLTVRGHHNTSDHVNLAFNLEYTVDASLLNTKVVRRGSATLYDIDELNVGQNVRMFGLLDTMTNTLSLTAPTDVVRVEPTRIYGHAIGEPTGGLLTIQVERVDLRDAGLFDWTAGGMTETALVLSVGNLGTGQGLFDGAAIEATGFFEPVSNASFDFLASTLINLDTRGTSVLLIRDRLNGMTVTTTPSTTAIEFAFAGAPGTLERAVVDGGFAGTTDVTGSGIRVVPNVLGLGLYTIRDRALNTISIHFTFEAFSEALQTALGSASLYNFGAAGSFDSGAGEITSALATAVVQ